MTDSRRQRFERQVAAIVRVLREHAPEPGSTDPTQPERRGRSERAGNPSGAERRPNRSLRRPTPTG
jgi:hypothetical protein